VNGEAPDDDESDHHGPVHRLPAPTDDIPGAASDVDGVCPIPAYADLHQDNRMMDEMVRGWAKESRESFISAVRKISAAFLAQQTEDTIFDWNVSQVEGVGS